MLCDLVCSFGSINGMHEILLTEFLLILFIYFIDFLYLVQTPHIYIY